MPEKKKVAVLQHDIDAADLSKMVLEPLGYEVQTFDYTVDPVVKVAEYRPDVLVIDFFPHPDHCWDVLARLAEDPDTVRLPVVAIAATERGVQDALTYVDVAQTLLAPYSIDELADKVKAAIEAAPLLPWLKPPVVREEVLVQAARLLAKESRDIVFRWLRHITATEPFKFRRDLRLPDLIDRVPLLITVFISVLRFGFTPEAMEARKELWETAKAHAAERRKQNIPLEAVVREYQYLREEIWQTLMRSMPKERLTSDDVFILGERLNHAMENLLAVSVQKYTESA